MGSCRFRLASTISTAPLPPAFFLLIPLSHPLVGVKETSVPASTRRPRSCRPLDVSTRHAANCHYGVPAPPPPPLPPTVPLRPPVVAHAVAVPTPSVASSKRKRQGNHLVHGVVLAAAPPSSNAAMLPPVVVAGSRKSASSTPFCARAKSRSKGPRKKVSTA